MRFAFYALEMTSKLPARRRALPSAASHAAVQAVARLCTFIGFVAVSALSQSACAVRNSATERFPGIAAQTGKSIKAVSFVGTDPFSPDSLQKLIESHPTRCSLLGVPLCLGSIGRQTHRIDPATVARDVDKLALFYRTEGYFGTRVQPTVDARGDEDVRLTFAVQRGEAIVLDALNITGTEGIMDPDSLERSLPAQPGSIFSLRNFINSGDIVINALHSSGHAYAQILRNYTVDTVDNRAVASIEAIPGPKVVVDSIIVRGGEHLGRANTLRQLSFKPGDVLQAKKLADSQLNLYGLELVQIASVSVAPDSMQKPPPYDSTTATIVVNIAETPVHQAEASIGFGTVECLRADASLLNRSFGGGARRLAFTGSVSKLGLGGRTESGLGKRICRAFNSDTTIQSKIDYRFAIDFTQPYFLSPKNQVSLNLYEERQSEPGLFQREVRGGRVGLNRRLARRSFATLAYDIERGSTIAQPALYCAAFLVCQVGITDSLARPRRRASLDLSVTHDRTDSPIDPSNGFNATSTFTVAPAFLASQVRFVRLTAQGAFYHEVKPGWVIALGARFGNFFRTATLDPNNNFLPPQERFFAGGTNSVRGFDRNGIGPGVYVTDSIQANEKGDTVPLNDVSYVATGGTSLGVASAELRFPSPVLTEFMRLALFVDAGAVGSGSLWQLSAGDWKLTPGVGARLQTPVGPVRLDVAYNPYGSIAAPLMFNDIESNTLRRVNSNFSPTAGSFFSRIHITLGIGQAY